MEYEEAHEKLKSIGQQHLLNQWNILSSDRQNSLLLQIKSIDIEAYRLQLNALKSSSFQSILSFDPFLDFSTSGNRDDIITGKQLITEGKVGCLIVAGGQGTRLGFNGPKGMFPISPIKHKSLFQLFAEKTLAAGKQAERSLPLAIMTSPLNHEETVNFFHRNHFFGLQADQVTFFSQKLLPFLDEEGNLFFDRQGVIAQGPDGNGFSLKQFYESGTWKRWKEQGVRYVNYVIIDNPLADPYDAELIAYHDRHRGDVTIKCTIRSEVNEKVGLLIKKNGIVQIIEYNEISEEEKKARNADGSLRHQCANLSLFCFSMDFIKQVALTPDSLLPLHAVFKNIASGQEMKGWKFERFIFDVLFLAKNVRALLYPRESCFAPLKNTSGEGSIQMVQEALVKNDRQTLAKITGKALSDHPVEIAQDFYYPTRELIEKWKGRFPNTDYIEP